MSQNDQFFFMINIFVETVIQYSLMNRKSTSPQHLFEIEIFCNIITSCFSYFYAHFRISHKKPLDGNGKMRINSKNVHKKHMRTFELDKLFIR